LYNVLSYKIIIKEIIMGKDIRKIQQYPNMWNGTL